MDRALADAGTAAADIDAVVVGKAPDLFEGVMMPELYLADALGAVGKPLLRVHTAGSVGGATGLVATSLVQAGVHRRVLAVAFEKQSESNAMWALSITPPFSMPVLAGAGGYFSPHIRAYIRRSGAPGHIGAMVAVKDRRNGSLNPYAHLQQADITLEKVLASPMLWDPVRYDETCPSSDGACAVVIGDQAAAEAAEADGRPVAWIRATAMRTEPTMFAGKDHVNPRAGADAAAALWRQAGITNPLEQIDVAEIYVPFSWFEPMWLENLGFAAPGEGWRLTEAGETEIGGKLPVNPSGGVLSSNPIGASGLLRFAESALQVMGKAGAHQVPGARTALGHAYGGGSQYFSMWVVAATPELRTPGPGPGSLCGARPRRYAKENPPQLPVGFAVVLGTRGQEARMGDRDVDRLGSQRVSWADARLRRPVVDPAIPPADRGLLTDPGTQLTPACRDRPARRRDYLPRDPGRRLATVDGAAMGLTGAMMIAVFGTAPLAVGVLGLQAATPWESASSHYALLVAEIITIITIVVFGFRVALFGQPTGKVPAEVAARTHHGRYLTDHDFGEPDRRLLRRAQDAIDAVTSSHVCRADVLDRAAVGAFLAGQEWDIAVALREQARLRARRAELAKTGTGPAAAAHLAGQAQVAQRRRVQPRGQGRGAGTLRRGGSRGGRRLPGLAAGGQARRTSRPAPGHARPHRRRRARHRRHRGHVAAGPRRSPGVRRTARLAVPARGPPRAWPRLSSS